MANPVIKIKRSAVAGKIPTSDQLPLGEIALNTYDGRLFASRDVGIGTTVFAVNPWVTGVGTNAYNTYFTEGNVGINTTNPPDKLTVSGRVQIQQDSSSNNRIVFRAQPGSSYRWNIDNYGSNNEFRIFREDDATAAYGFVAVTISSTGTVTATTSVITNTQGTNLNYSGISTLGSVNCGNINSSGIITATNAFISTLDLNAADITSTTSTTTTTAATAIVSISTSIYRSAVFQIQAVQGTNYNMTTINVIHDGVESYMTEYGTINQPIGIATFSTDISAGSLRLLAYPASINSTTFKVIVNATQI